MMATMGPVRWQPQSQKIRFRFRVQTKRVATVKAFGKDMDRVWREAWRSANHGFDRFLFEAIKTAQRLDRRYSLSRRLSSVARSAADRARDIDREFDIRHRCRTFSIDFQRKWPNYRKQLNSFLDSPLGKTFAVSNFNFLNALFVMFMLLLINCSAQTLFFLWFALSGWLFRFLIIATWVLPFAGPLLIGTLANTLVIKGTCPACNMQFGGYKNQIIRCTGCGNIVWQPKGKGNGERDFFSRGGRSKSDPDIIDVDFEEK